MAAGDTLQGRRVKGLPEEPGDYTGPRRGYTGDKPAVFFLKPNARAPDAPPAARKISHVTFPPHSYVEHEDGTLTISASIGDTRRSHPGESDGWHGYLERGIWRQV